MTTPPRTTTIRGVPVYWSETLKRYCTIPQEDRREYVPATPARRGEGQRVPLIGRITS